MTPSPIAAQDRSEPPEGYDVRDFSRAGWGWAWSKGGNWRDSFHGMHPSEAAAIAAAWTHAEKETD